MQLLVKIPSLARLKVLDYSRSERTRNSSMQLVDLEFEAERFSSFSYNTREKFPFESVKNRSTPLKLTSGFRSTTSSTSSADWRLKRKNWAHSYRRRSWTSPEKIRVGIVGFCESAGIVAREIKLGVDHHEDWLCPSLRLGVSLEYVERLGALM